MIVPPSAWSIILAHIEAHVAAEDIARQIGVARTALYRWADGSVPLHHNGEALLDLHDLHCDIHHCELKRAQYRPRTSSATDGADDDRRDPAGPDAAAGAGRR